MEEDTARLLKRMQDGEKGMLDLSRDEDLSIAVMHLISLEEHFAFTFMKTPEESYLESLNAVRLLRIGLLKKLVTKPQGEEWCISKHLLGGAMRLIEVGTKELQKKQVEEAERYFNAAFQLYSLFFVINMKRAAKDQTDGKNHHGAAVGEPKTTIFQRAVVVVKKLVDCCRE